MAPLPWRPRDVVAYFVLAPAGLVAVLLLVRPVLGPQRRGPITAIAVEAGSYAVLLGALILLVRLRRGSLTDLGWRDPPLLWLVVAPLVCVVALLALEVFLQLHSNVIIGRPNHAAECRTSLAELSAAPPAAIAVVCLLVPLTEETMFRGFLFPTLRRRWSFATSAVISAALFGAAHLEPRTLLALTGVGVVLAWLRERTGSIFPGVVVHAVHNGMAVLLIAAAGCP